MRTLRLVLLLTAALAPACSMRSATVKLGEGEHLAPPTSARIGQVFRAADHPLAWGDVAPVLNEAALRAYGAGRLSAAQRWHLLAQWASLFGATEQDCIVRWGDAVRAARTGHDGIPSGYSLRPVAIGARLSGALAGRLFADADFSATFFGTLGPTDFLPAVLAILGELHSADPTGFSDYPALANAIAVVAVCSAGDGSVTTTMCRA